MYGVKEEGITCFSCHCWTGAYLSNLSSNLGRLVLNAGLYLLIVNRLPRWPLELSHLPSLLLPQQFEKREHSSESC